MRYLTEGSPSLRDVAKVTASLVERELEWRVREGLCSGSESAVVWSASRSTDERGRHA